MQHIKVERQKVLHFKYHSKMSGVGEFKQAFNIKRKTALLMLEAVKRKAVFMEGQTAASAMDEMTLNAITTLGVYFEPLDEHGKVIANSGWIDDLPDTDIVFALYQEWINYQNSFYPELNETPSNTESKS